MTMKNRNLPSGTRDEFGPRAAVKEQITAKLLAILKQRGFEKLTTPILEYADVFKPLNLTNNRAYQLLDEQGEALVLRPDLTLPVARMLSTTGVELPAKWYYSGDVFRVKKQLSGSYNQISEAGFELVGYGGLKGEWESLMIALAGCRETGVTEMTLELSDARFVASVLEALPVPTPTKQALQQALFAKNLTTYQQISALLAKTPFGPFLAEWPWLFGEFDDVMKVVAKLPAIPALTPVIDDLKATAAFLKQQAPSQRVVLDLSIPSPQRYYTGMAFRGYTQNASDYLFSGGRYDDLLKSFQQVKEPAVGLAFDVDALADKVATPATPPQTLIYFDADQWQLAEATLARTPNSTLCLADSREEAERIAVSTAKQLIDLTESR
ncbi:ATP phosphoribosyltransferase, regulatory subunit [Secundilactobacillus odoratitofui DSM 19909 = JCM 15043]|uniref:ATP phosphoribosyltransferase regulatory subunit n=2 Tax=Secundilactobacillus odoratitofui TaxID=480930 RepID=A0A0R1M590_9LACO|nr:ATP phosphoribosyltransferase, regulatory subunit [Secundilactobacillus odoratitofui DSM 19909 = JCM 15043]